MNRFKDLLTDRACELALEKYNLLFLQLSDQQQAEIWNLAEQDLADRFRHEVDGIRERMKESKL